MEKVEAAKKAGDRGLCYFCRLQKMCDQTEISGDERKSSMYICENVYDTAKS